MRKVKREDISDYVTYNENREAIRKEAMAAKEQRRIHLGDHLTFLFENTTTTHYQIQEMMRIEKLVKEESIQHELDTYNNLLGPKGEISCTLLIEYSDEAVRDQKLRELLDLPKHIYLESKTGERYNAHYDKTQVGEEKVSAVQFLKFKCSETPVKLACDHTSMTESLDLSKQQIESLSLDLQDE